MTFNVNRLYGLPEIRRLVGQFEVNVVGFQETYFDSAKHHRNLPFGNNHLHQPRQDSCDVFWGGCLPNGSYVTERNAMLLKMEQELRLEKGQPVEALWCILALYAAKEFDRFLSVDRQLLERMIQAGNASVHLDMQTFALRLE